MAALLPICVLTQAHAQVAAPELRPSLDASPGVQPETAAAAPATQTPSPAAPTLGVNIFDSLNPVPPTGAASKVVQTATSTNPANWNMAPGYNTGAITFYPGVTYATFYDDNVFALPTHRLGDWAFVLRPEFTWRSNNWENVEVGGNAYVEGRKYTTYFSEDQVNAGASVGGTANVGSNAQAVGRLQYVHGHEDRGVSDTITDRFIDPIAYDQGEAGAALNLRWDHVWSSLGGTALIQHYEDAILADGLIASQSYRNGNIERVPARLGYVVAPQTSLFVEASGQRRDFDVGLYSSLGYRVVGGLLFEPAQGQKVRGEVTAGYMEQDYNGPTLKTVSTWTAAGSLSFLLTDVWTFTVEGRRDPREASYSGGVFLFNDGVSIIESLATVRTDYHITTDLVVGAGVSYIQDHYLDTARTDRAWSPTASIKYTFAPKISFGIDYRHVDFSSSGFGVLSYTRNIYLLSASVQF